MRLRTVSLLDIQGFFSASGASSHSLACILNNSEVSTDRLSALHALNFFSLIELHLFCPCFTLVGKGSLLLKVHGVFTQVIQDNLHTLISVNFLSCAKSLLPYNATYSQVKHQGAMVTGVKIQLATGHIKNTVSEELIGSS